MMRLVVWVWLTWSGHTLKLLGALRNKLGTRNPPRSVALKDKVSEGKTVLTSIGRMRILKQLGEGSFGSVFKAEWMEARKLVAFKIELAVETSKCIVGNAPRGYLAIEHEWTIMAAMNRTDGFPLVYTHNFSGKYKYYVMQLLGGNVSGIRKLYPDKRIPKKRFVPFAHQMLDRIETLHDRDVLMYDIHLGNFMVDKEKIFVIDLGMAIPFRYESGKHVRYSQSPISDDCKQAYYCSRHDAAGKVVSRRDDLERLIFIWIDLSTGRLPWSHLKDWNAIQLVKLEISAEKLCVGVEWMIPIVEYVFGMSFTDRPNYAYIHGLLNKGLT
jgi:serine/threonine protein kinase